MPDIKDSDQFVLRTHPDYSGERKCCRSMKTIKTKNVDVITHNTVFADITILSVYQMSDKLRTKLSKNHCRLRFTATKKLNLNPAKQEF